MTHRVSASDIDQRKVEDARGQTDTREKQRAGGTAGRTEGDIPLPAARKVGKGRREAGVRSVDYPARDARVERRSGVTELRLGTDSRTVTRTHEEDRRQETLPATRRREHDCSWDSDGTPQ